MPAARKVLAPLCTLAVTLLAIGCNADDGSGPKLDRPASPDSTGVAFDVTTGPQNGTFSVGPATFIIKGFNHTNPRLGDAIVATFVWLGRATIDSVTDWTTTNPLTPVGNTYHLVHRVARGQVSMATYVATNVQNFAGGVTDLPGNSIYAVRADFSDTVFGGVILTSYSGVYPDWPRALDAHRAASGTDSTTVLAMTRPVRASAGALAYAVTASNALVPLTLNPPPGLTEIAIMSDDLLKAGAWYTNWQSTNPFQPQWVWELGLSPLQRRSWVASALTLNQAPTRLAFTNPPTDAKGCSKVFTPRIRVAAMDDKGNPTPAFDKVVTVQLKRDGLPLPPSALSGEVTTTAKNGVAEFKRLCVTEPAAGYTLVATSAFGDMSVESAPFTITAP